jgi:hypothetical protein
MSDWWREARVGAARQFGAQHYRKFAAAGAAKRLRVPIVLVVLVVGGWLAWRGIANSSVIAPSLPWVWIGVAAGAVVLVALARFGLLAPVVVLAGLAGAGWLAWLAVNSWVLPWAWIGVVAGVLALVGAAATRLLVPLLVLAAVGGAGWLLWMVATAWSVPWPWLAGAAAVAVLLRWRLRYRMWGGLLLRFWR